MEKWLVIAAALGVGLAGASGVLAGYELIKGAQPRPISRSEPATVAGAPANEIEPGEFDTAADALAGRELATFEEKRAQERDR